MMNPPPRGGLLTHLVTNYRRAKIRTVHIIERHFWVPSTEKYPVHQWIKINTEYRKRRTEKRHVPRTGKMLGREAFLKTVPKHKGFKRSRIKH